jgi:hypothetical protein
MVCVNRRGIILYSYIVVGIGSPPPPPPQASVSSPAPLGPKGGEGQHSLVGDEVGGTQFGRRLERKPGTVYKLWIYLMPCFLFQVASSTWTTNMLRLDPTFNAGKTNDIFPHSCTVFPCINLTEDNTKVFSP